MAGGRTLRPLAPPAYQHVGAIPGHISSAAATRNGREEQRRGRRQHRGRGGSGSGFFTSLACNDTVAASPQDAAASAALEAAPAPTRGGVSSYNLRGTGSEAWGSG